MEFYYSLDDGKEMSPLSVDTEGDMTRKCNALQEEVDDLKTHLSSKKEYSRLLQDYMRDLRRELWRTNRELQKEKYSKREDMNREKEARCPPDIRHMQYTRRSPMTRRRSFRDEVENFRPRAHRPIHGRWSRHMEPHQRGGSDSWRR